MLKIKINDRILENMNIKVTGKEGKTVRKIRRKRQRGYKGSQESLVAYK